MKNSKVCVRAYGPTTMSRFIPFLFFINTKESHAMWEFTKNNIVFILAPDLIYRSNYTNQVAAQTHPKI